MPVSSEPVPPIAAATPGSRPAFPTAPPPVQRYLVPDPVAPPAAIFPATLQAGVVLDVNGGFHALATPEAAGSAQSKGGAAIMRGQWTAGGAAFELSRITTAAGTLFTALSGGTTFCCAVSEKGEVRLPHALVIDNFSQATCVYVVRRIRGAPMSSANWDTALAIRR